MIGKDLYICNCKNTMITNYQDLLMEFYLPLIGSIPVSLYLLLCAEIRKGKYCQIDRLCTLTSMNIDQIEQNIVILEQYRLLTTYRQQNKYVFLLSNPLNAYDFYKDPVFSRLFMRKVGMDQYYYTYNKYVENKIDVEKLENISHKFDLSVLNDWDSIEEEKMNKQEELVQEGEIDFDYESFFKIIDASSLTALPQQYRQQEYTNYIGQLASYYCIAPRQMAALVSKCMLNNDGILDKDELKNMCISSNNLIEKNRTTDEYNQSPVSFLSSLVLRPVSISENKLIEVLKQNYGLKNEVINVLIEYTLKKCKKKFARAFAEAAASDWHNNNIDSVEKAKSQIEKLQQANYSTTNKTQQHYSFDQMVVEQSDIEKLRKELYSKG